MMTSAWQPNNWRSFPIKQQPLYDNIIELKKIESQLAMLPAIVQPETIIALQTHLQKVYHGQAMIVQGGDCVETFARIKPSNLWQYVRMMSDISLLLQQSLKKEIITIGRIAGQFAKPRSHDFEIHNNHKIPVYRGDIINSIKQSQEARKPNPYRLLTGYHHSIKALKTLRSFIKKSTLQHYISHEALLLNYEQCFTRKYNNQYFNLAAHFIWIGNRTRSLDGAHIEYIRGINNPVGIKIDDTMHADEIIKLLEIVNPHNLTGKIILIFRMGAHKIKHLLPAIIKSIKQEQKSVIFMCDPMHGNTVVKSGKKIRNFKTILLELQCFIDILKIEKVHFGGVHLEMTNQNIIECVEEDGIIKNYDSYCDPRLNLQQSIRLMNYIITSFI